MLRPIPIQVPWKISASGSNIRIAMVEDETLEISMLADLDWDGAPPMPTVILQFEAGLWLRMNSFPDDSMGLGDVGFDVSHLLEMLAGDFQERWEATRMCPVSGFYRVEDSPWAAEVEQFTQRVSQRHGRKFPDRGWRYTHYIVAGRESWIEVLAKGFTWRMRAAEPDK